MVINVNSIYLNNYFINKLSLKVLADILQNLTGYIPWARL